MLSTRIAKAEQPTVKLLDSTQSRLLAFIAQSQPSIAFRALLRLAEPPRADGSRNTSGDDFAVDAST